MRFPANKKKTPTIMTTLAKEISFEKRLQAVGSRWKRLFMFICYYSERTESRETSQFFEKHHFKPQTNAIPIHSWMYDALHDDDCPDEIRIFLSSMILMRRSIN